MPIDLAPLCGRLAVLCERLGEALAADPNGALSCEVTGQFNAARNDVETALPLIAVDLLPPFLDVQTRLATDALRLTYGRAVWMSTVIEMQCEARLKNTPGSYWAVDADS